MIVCVFVFVVCIVVVFWWLLLIGYALFLGYSNVSFLMITILFLSVCGWKVCFRAFMFFVGPFVARLACCFCSRLSFSRLYAVFLMLLLWIRNCCLVFELCSFLVAWFVPIFWLIMWIFAP